MRLSSLRASTGFAPCLTRSSLMRRSVIIRYSVRWLSNAFAAAAKRDNVEGVSFQRLRQTAVSRCRGRGSRPDHHEGRRPHDGGHGEPLRAFGAGQPEGGNRLPGRKRSYTGRTKSPVPGDRKRSFVTPSLRGGLEVAVRFELTNNGFANRPLRPLGYATI